MTARLQPVFDELLARKDVRHAVLAVESGDGRLAWAAAGGDADGSGRRMTPDTPYFIASVSKLYIAAVVLRLAERGLLRLDEPFARHVPPGVADRLHVIGGVDRTREITVRHLLAHASGLPDYLEEKPKRGRRLIDRLRSEGDRGVGLAKVARMVRDDLSPRFPPRNLDGGRRVRVRYSDTNYRLLVAVIETVLGVPWSEALRTELLEPLGLRHTWAPGGQPLAPAPGPAALWAGSELFDAPRMIASCGDLFSTAADQIAFLRALRSGAAFGHPATAAMMHDRWNAFGFDPTSPRLPGWPIEYGLGMMRFTLPRWLTPFASVPPLIGHSGSTGCWLFYCPELDLYTCGGVDQLEAGAVPFRTLPKLLGALRGHRRHAPERKEGREP